MAEPLVSVRDLTKSYGDRTVLRGISFDVPPGSVQVLLGTSGSGKSTVIRCLNGLETFQSGTILFDGQPVEQKEKAWQRLRTRIGMVFQSYDLFPNLTVIENVSLAPLKVQNRDRDEVAAHAADLLAQVGMADYHDKYPRQLSGGQKQRVAIVRALAMKPDLMLFDEVTASLDPEMVRGVLEILLGLARGSMTMIIVTHEMEFARRVADTVLFLDGGKILEATPGAEFFAQPRSERARHFLDSMAPLPDDDDPELSAESTP
jgi:polar amino acid transport system ATP-binding protein